jgi:putative transcriptional regulator
MSEYVKNEVLELRMQRGITQEEFAHAVEVSRQTVIAIEKGHYAPSVLLALKIGQFFKTPVEKIFAIAYDKR